MCGQGKKEKKKEKRSEKEKEKKKEKREKRKKEGKKEGTGGIRGVGHEPGVASTRSDVHEKRGEE